MSRDGLVGVEGNLADPRRRGPGKVNTGPPGRAADRAGASASAKGSVAEKPALVDGQGHIGAGGNAPARTEGRSDPGGAVAADDLVPGEGASADDYGCTRVACDGTALGRDGRRVHPPAPHGPVAGKRTLGNGQGAALAINAASGRGGARRAPGLVIGDDNALQGQIAALVPDAAAVVGQAVGNRQIVDAHACAARNMEYPTGVVAADRQ